jgi:hypothetical protein
MVTLKTHATFNLLLNVALLAGIFVSVFLAYFSFLDYDVGLYNLQHRLKFEDVEGVVSIKFPSFKEIACGVSSDAGIVTVCSNIDYF